MVHGAVVGEVKGKEQEVFNLTPLFKEPQPKHHNSLKIAPPRV
jgi:hypothetical protein